MIKTQNSCLISVIVPVYNVEKYINRCIDSILSQTYKNLEVILVDDGSKDNSGAICEKYKRIDSRIKVIHKENGGLSSARNAGLDCCTGDYIGFIDSDDWIDENMYQILLDNMIEFDTDVSDCEILITNGSVPAKKGKYSRSVLREKEMLIDYFRKDKVSVCCKLYKRSVIEKMRFPVGKINEDIATNYLFIKNATSIVKDSRKMYYYYLNPCGITGGFFKPKDYDLLYACDTLVETNKDDAILLKYAYSKKTMGYFSLLVRYLRYKSIGFDDPKIVARSLQKEFRKGARYAFKSWIPFKKRFVSVFLLLININLLKKFFRN